MTTRLRGVLAPVLTPFNAKLEPDVDRFIAHCGWLVRNHAALAIFGTNFALKGVRTGARTPRSLSLIHI